MGAKTNNVMYRFLFFSLSLLWIQPVAWAVEVDENGVGDVLLFPYYTTRGDNSTLLSIENTSEDVIALKVNILEGDNGESVLSFNVYMGFFDTWTATLVNDGTQTLLRTRDATCTVPRFFDEDTGTGQLTLGENLLADLAANPNSGRQSLDRVQEGYIMITNMGTLDGPEAAFAITTSEPVPNNCQGFVNMWDNNTSPPGIWTIQPHHNIASQRGLITGEATIINRNSSRAASYSAFALKDFYIPDETQPPSLHAFPEFNSPTLQDAYPPVSRVTIDLFRPELFRVVPELITDTWPTGLQAVEAVLTASEVATSLAAEPEINGSTEWVITFPTKRDHVFNTSEQSLPPFSVPFGQDNNDGACERVSYLLLDRDSRTHPVNVTGNPPPTITTDICYQTNVITYNNTPISSTASEHENEGLHSSLFGSRLFNSLTSTAFPSQEQVLISTLTRQGSGTLFTSGTFFLRLNRVLTNAQFRELVNPESGNIYRGLPIIGINMSAAESASANAFFSVIEPHRYERIIIQPEQN